MGPRTGPRKTADSNTLVGIHGIPHFCNDTGAVSQGCDSEETADKAGDKQSLYVVSAGLAYVEVMYIARVPTKLGRRSTSSEQGPRMRGRL